MLRVLSPGDHTIVTTRAGAHHLQMIDPRNRTERHRVVAVLANIGRRNVISRLTRGRRSVVAGRTIAVYAGMIEECGHPRLCPMAVVALIAGWQMAGRFSGGSAVVVAALATSVGLEMIDPRDRHPGRSPVACVTPFRCRNVGRRLHRCTDQARRSMTVPALCGRTGEIPVDMA